MKPLTKAERKRMWAALAKTVHPVRITESERARLYEVAMANRGKPGWTS